MSDTTTHPCTGGACSFPSLQAKRNGATLKRRADKLQQQVDDGKKAKIEADSKEVADAKVRRSMTAASGRAGLTKDMHRFTARCVNPCAGCGAYSANTSGCNLEEQPAQRGACIAAF